MPIMCPSSRCWEARLRPPGVQMLLRAQRLLGPRGPQTPRPCWGPARCRGRAGSSGPPPDPLAGPQCCPPQAPSVTLGFRAAADLLSPLALLRFSAVARGPDPPTGVSKEPALGGGAGGVPQAALGAACASGPLPLLTAPQGLAACAAWAWSTSSTSSCSPAWSSRSASWCTSASGSAGGMPRTPVDPHLGTRVPRAPPRVLRQTAQLPEDGDRGHPGCLAV